MLSKQHRLKKTSDFQRAYKKGIHRRGKSGKVVFFKRHDNEPSRFGTVIPAKLGNAVKRNRAKRQIREILRKMLHNIPDNYDIVIILWRLLFDFKAINKDIRNCTNEIFVNDSN